MTIGKKSGPKSLMLMVVMTTVLWEIAVSRSVSATMGGDLIQVASTPTGLTVDAHGADVVQILREVGKQMGFTVVARGVSYPTVDISIKETPLEEVLQQLLRGKSYTLVYRPQIEGKAEGNGKLGKVVLLRPSPRFAVTPAAEPERQQQERYQPPTQNQGSTPRLSDGRLGDRATAATARQSGWRDTQEQRTGNPLTDPLTVNDLLEDQVLQTLAVNDYAETLPSDDPLSTEESSEAVSEEIQLGEEGQRDMRQNLALMTQVAQRNVATLVESLAAATDAFLDAQAAQKRSGR